MRSRARSRLVGVSRPPVECLGQTASARARARRASRRARSNVEDDLLYCKLSVQLTRGLGSICPVVADLMRWPPMAMTRRHLGL